MKNLKIRIPAPNIVNELKDIIEKDLRIDIDNPSRVRPIVEARFMYYHILHKYYNFSLNQIGATVNKDHATVLHGLRQFENLYEFDSFFKEKFVSFELLVDKKLGILANPYDKYLGAEDKLQREVLKWLNLQYPEAFVVHIPNEGRRTMFERYKFKQLGGVSGMPDLMIFNPNKKYNGLAIELKAGSNKPTKNQLECLKRLQSMDWVAFWSADFEDIQRRVNSYFGDI